MLAFDFALDPTQLIQAISVMGEAKKEKECMCSRDAEVMRELEAPH
jgi:hypothetical protein